MPKLPGKFDDICKMGKSALDDDYKTKGYQFEAKQKTNFDGAVSTVTVDFQQTGVFTPAKLSWKFPKLFGIAGLAIDKFEYDKEGKMKLECAMKQDLHRVDELTLEAKSDCKDASNATVGLTYTGLKNALVKFETKLTKPTNFMNFTGECLYGVGPIVIGAKFKRDKIPDVGVNFAQGNLFASIMAKKTWTEGKLMSGQSEIHVYHGHLLYNVTPDIALVATGTNQGAWTVGGSAKICKSFCDSGISAKAKIDNEMVASVSFKMNPVKGTTATLGGSYGEKEQTIGVKLALE